MSASHPLDGDGISHLLYHYLAKDATMLAKKRGTRDTSPTEASTKRSKRKHRNSCNVSFRVPDTVVFFNTPTTWYYWDENSGRCEKKDAKELEKENLEKFFGQPTGKNCDICCSFLSRKSGEPDSVLFLDKYELHDFLYARPEHHGLLQRFIIPQGEKNFMYQALWCRRNGAEGTEGITKVFKRISRERLKDRFIMRNKKATNPAAAGSAVLGPLAKYRRMQLKNLKNAPRGLSTMYAEELFKAAKICETMESELLDDSSHYSKGVTFEGAAHYAEERWCHAGISNKVQRACQNVVDHFEAIDHTFAIARMVLYFKEDVEGKLWLMFSTAMRIQEAHHKVPQAPSPGPADKFQDIYRFTSALTPNFKGAFSPNTEEPVPRSSKKLSSLSHRNTRPLPGYISPTGTTSSLDAKHTHVLTKMEKKLKILSEKLQHTSNQNMGLECHLKEQIGTYAEANLNLQNEIRGLQKLTSLASSVQEGDAVIRYVNIKKLARKHLPNEKKTAAAHASIAGAMCCALAHVGQQRRKRIRGDDLTRHLKTKGDISMRLRSISKPLTGCKAHAVSIILASHEKQAVVKVHDGRMYRKDDYKFISPQWELLPIEAPLSAILEVAQEPAAVFSDILYTCVTEATWRRYAAPCGMRPLSNITQNTPCYDVAMEVMEYFPKDYIFEVPEDVAVHLIDCEKQLEDINILFFHPANEYRRLIDAEELRYSHDARCHGVRPEYLEKSLSAIEDMRAKHVRMQQSHRPYLCGPLTLTVHYDTRGSIPEYNRFLNTFRKKVGSVVSRSMTEFRRNLEAHVEQCGLWAELKARVTKG